jgi:hypothetical protein
MITKKDYENELNEIGIPDHDIKSEGGRIPDNAKYGTWLRANDPIAFSVGYREYVQETEYALKHNPF